MRHRWETVPDWAVLTLVCLGQFMVVLDVSVVNVALPAIRGDLHLSESGLQWVVNAYAIAFAGFLLLGGRAADLFGRKRVFQLGLTLFTVSSLVGGFAQSGGWLLAARTAQGLGGAVLSPATLTILTTTFPEGPRRAKALGVWSALAGAGGAAGALLGGLLTDYVSWRWILFINVPIGVIGILAAAVVLHESRAETRSRALDIPGAVLVTAGLMVFIYAIVSTDKYSWGSGRTLLTLVVAAVLIAGFFVDQVAVAKAPLMPLSIFRMRSVSAANGVMLLTGAAIFSSWYFLALYEQEVLHYSPLVSGLSFLPQTVSIVIGAQISSRLVSRVGPRAILLVAPVVSAAGLLWLSQLPVHGTYVRNLLVPMVLVTTGMGFAFTPLAIAATGGVPREQAGLASGLLNTMRQLGGGVGLAVLATIALDRAKVASPLNPGSTVGQAAGYDRAFLVAGFIALAAALAAAVLPRLRQTSQGRAAQVAAEREAHGPPAGALTGPAVAVPEPD